MVHRPPRPAEACPRSRWAGADAADSGAACLPSGLPHAGLGWVVWVRKHADRTPMAGLALLLSALSAGAWGADVAPPSPMPELPSGLVQLDAPAGSPRTPAAVAASGLEPMDTTGLSRIPAVEHARARAYDLRMGSLWSLDSDLYLGIDDPFTGDPEHLVQDGTSQPPSRDAYGHHDGALVLEWDF